VRTVLLDLERLAQWKENELSVLLGHNPGAIARGVELDAQPVPSAVPAGLPSELLERRPDLRQAEQELVSANARIGEAVAMRYPRISLTGALGLASTDLGELLDGDSTTGSLFGQIVQPLFQGGKTKRRVEVAESRQRQAVFEYEKAILDAFREVEDGLVAYQKTGEQRSAQRDRVGADRRVLELAELRYKGGVADYLEVLDAQRSLFTSELDEAEAVRNHMVSLVTLYKALGGGWLPAPRDDTNTTQGQP
jgi:multidrug efflux system outer membrane protein